MDRSVNVSGRIAPNRSLADVSTANSTPVDIKFAYDGLGILNTMRSMPTQVGAVSLLSVANVACGRIHDEGCLEILAQVALTTDRASRHIFAPPAALITFYENRDALKTPIELSDCYL